jgi:hypothetical protein
MPKLVVVADNDGPEDRAGITEAFECLAKMTQTVLDPKIDESAFNLRAYFEVPEERIEAMQDFINGWTMFGCARVGDV